MSFSNLPARVIFLLALWGIAVSGQAQADSVLITKNYKFEDGLYFSLSDFQRNRPAVPWSKVQATLASNPKTFLIQVERLYADSLGIIDPVSLWGLCLKGIPYIRLPEGAADKELPTFAGMQVRGRICYFEYARDTVYLREMAAYNPLTRRPFRRGRVPVEETLLFRCMLDFETGEVAPFDLPHFLGWIREDERLYRTFSEMDPADAEGKLFKGLLIYLDRNALFLPRNPTHP